MLDRTDVVVIGGGPAGSTAAALLAAAGWQVKLFERARHPRFHIGESLLPMNLPILQRLGVLGDVARMGVHKPGADFTVAGESNHQRIAFADALGTVPDHAYQVRRAEFDELLLSNAKRLGAEVYEGHRVKRVDLANEFTRAGFHTVELCDEAGAHHTLACRYVIDASGQNAVLSKQHKWRRRDLKHSAAAVFSHFEGVVPRSGEEGGNISVYWFEHGWCWVIPLQNGVTSVGVVSESEALRRREGDLESHYYDCIASCPALRDRLAHACCVQPVRSAANYSYASKKQLGANYALLGDAYCFVDPVFSSGVYLAMSSAESIVPIVASALKNQRLRGFWQRWGYRRRIRRGVNAFRWFIYRFNTPAMSYLFSHQRNVLKVQQAVVSLLAGDVFDRGEVPRRLWVFRRIYTITALWLKWRRIDATPPAGVYRQKSPDSPDPVR